MREVREDNLGVDEGSGVEVCKKGREKCRGITVEAIGLLEETMGFFGQGFAVNGPEKACLLTFLALDKSCCADERPSDSGGGNQPRLALLLLSVGTDCVFKMIGPDNFPPATSFSYLNWSKGDECHFWTTVVVWLVRFVWGSMLYDFTESGVFASTGVGRTYGWNLFESDEVIRAAPSAGSGFLPDKSGADLVMLLTSLKKEKLLPPWLLLRISYTTQQKKISYQSPDGDRLTSTTSYERRDHNKSKWEMNSFVSVKLMKKMKETKFINM